MVHKYHCFSYNYALKYQSLNRNPALNKIINFDNTFFLMRPCLCYDRSRGKDPRRLQGSAQPYCPRLSPAGYGAVCWEARPH